MAPERAGDVKHSLADISRARTAFWATSQKWISRKAFAAPSNGTAILNWNRNLSDP